VVLVSAVPLLTTFRRSRRACNNWLTKQNSFGTSRSIHDGALSAAPTFERRRLAGFRSSSRDRRVSDLGASLPPPDELVGMERDKNGGDESNGRDRGYLDGCR
jgi:hypothetical protein